MDARPVATPIAGIPAGTLRGTLRSASPIRIGTWHICISGFTQHQGRPSGLEVLWTLLRHTHANGSVVVELRAWNDRWDRLAEFIFRLRPLGALPRVYVYAYSWGAGFGFLRLARELGKRGLRIETAVLSDPVYCPPLWTLLPAALNPFRRIVIPQNVREVHWFYQRQSRPRGHQVVAADRFYTRVHPGVEAHASHAYMDDLADFWDLSVHVAHKAATASNAAHLRVFAPHTDGAHDAQSG